LESLESLENLQNLQIVIEMSGNYNGWQEKNVKDCSLERLESLENPKKIKPKLACLENLEILECRLRLERVWKVWRDRKIVWISLEMPRKSDNLIHEIWN